MRTSWIIYLVSFVSENDIKIIYYMTYFFWRCINFKRKKIDHISGGDKTLFGKSLNIQQT
jgi:hypothetical protein